MALDYTRQGRNQQKHAAEILRALIIVSATVQKMWGRFVILRRALQASRQ
jgi:hypothetical protein